MSSELLGEGQLDGVPASRTLSRPVRFRVNASGSRFEQILVHDPIVSALVLLLSMRYFNEQPTLPYVTLGLITYLLCGFLPPHGNGEKSGALTKGLIGQVLFRWVAIVSALLFVGFVTQAAAYYSEKVLVAWFCLTPVIMVLVQQAKRAIFDRTGGGKDPEKRYLIVGVNRVGLEVRDRLPGQKFMGFFDFRQADRVGGLVPQGQLIGSCDDLAEYVRNHAVNAVYIALPMSNTPRVAQMLSQLRDTTASVYFVPDIFQFDLIRGQVIDVHGVPALAICDTPQGDSDAPFKRLMDIVVAAAALLLSAPVILGIALAVKLTSPGPVLFKQRRYGLNGEQILVYKFRSMTVCEDGATVTQASRGDSRITPLGAFLRRTSLDEVPQLLNVLQGNMSLVGPRPHAVAHNEMYRRVINGYMIRHKVYPGITGWAQVHGLRGETDTLEKMRARIEFDLDYVNNWSLLLDLKILLKTARVLVTKENAY